MNATTHDQRGCDTDALNYLLRCELSAVETYSLAVARLDDQLVIADLQKIRDEHGRAVRTLLDHVVGAGGHPANSAEVWDAFASVVADAQVIAPTTALAALRQGEERVLAEYESALENEDIHPDCRRLILTDLLPAGRKHVEELNRLLGGMDH